MFFLTSMYLCTTLAVQQLSVARGVQISLQVRVWLRQHGIAI